MIERAILLHKENDVFNVPERTAVRRRRCKSPSQIRGQKHRNTGASCQSSRTEEPTAGQSQRLEIREINVFGRIFHGAYCGQSIGKTQIFGEIFATNSASDIANLQRSLWENW
jgi:hypothetical protein